jgi:hypothetical protein
MGWVRVDDAFYDHEKFQAAGPLGVAQWIAGLAWANRNLSDGFIPVSASRRLLDWEGVSWRGWSGDIVGGADEAESDEISDHLVDCLLWEKTLGGYQIHDYHDFQPTAEKIKGDRANNAARQAAWRANAGSGTASNETRNGVTNADVTGAPNPTPNPNPTPKKETSKKATAATPKRRRSAKSSMPEKLEPLRDAMSRSGIAVSWDCNSDGYAGILASLDRCGLQALLKHAQARYRPDSPAFSVNAFVAGWEALPGKPRPLELVHDPCPHEYDHPSRCPWCKTNAAAS